MESWGSISYSFCSEVSETIKAFLFETPTAVQEQCIPHFLSHKDVAVEALTGSGKTLAFLVPIIEILVKRKSQLKKFDVQALIIAPTHELAEQISSVVKQFLKNCPFLTYQICVGGVSNEADIDAFVKNGAHIIVGTPGKLEALFEAQHRSDFCLRSFCRSLEVLVLDEADRLLDMGFSASISTILSHLPKQRRTGLFSATMPDEMAELIRTGLRNPHRVTIRAPRKRTASCAHDDTRTPVALVNCFAEVAPDSKLVFLADWLRRHRADKIILFFSTCNQVDYFGLILKRFVTECSFTFLHGKLKESKRRKSFAAFRELAAGVMVCTDVMARGIDIPRVDWVVQFDIPVSARAFVHRCGRTARVDNVGNALILLMPNELAYVDFIKRNQKVQLKKYVEPEQSESVVETLKTPELPESSEPPKKLSKKAKKRLKSSTKTVKPIEQNVESPRPDESLNEQSTSQPTNSPSAPTTPSRVAKVQQLALSDRMFAEKGIRAFVSYLQSYVKHECHLILQLKEVDVGALASGTYCLLRLPKMPELRLRRDIRFTPLVRRLDDVPYADASVGRQRERQRQARLEKERQAEKEKIAVRRAHEKRRVDSARVRTTAKSNHVFSAIDLDELAADARLVRKLKRGEIDKETFDAEFL